MKYLVLFLMLALSTPAFAGERFNKMTSAEHLKYAYDAYKKNAFEPAKMHIRAIPSTAPEYKESRALIVTIDKTIAKRNAEANKPVIKTSKRKSKKWNGKPATEKDYDNVTTYATIMGRAVACGAQIGEPSSLVGAWIDRTFPPSERASQVYVYSTAIQYAAEQQNSGNSPDSCSSALRAFNKTRWP